MRRARRSSQVEGDGTAREYMVPPRAARPQRRGDPRRQHALPRRGGRPLRRQVGHRLRRARPRAGAREGAQGARARRPRRCARSLEIGAGTGYFTLNLLRAGRDRRGDLHRHLARACSRTLQRQRASASGSRCATEPADAERLPFADASFDLVLGHAVLHHIPDLAARLRASSSACSRPGGTVAVRRRALALRRPPGARAQARAHGASRRCGAARSARGPRRPPSGGAPDAALEGVVDVHAFAPGELRALRARRGLRATCA